MQKIDAHQHFWKFDPVRDSWINDDMAVIKRDFLPEDLAPILKEYHIDGCVVVQSDQSEVENLFQLQNAEQHNFVKGVVGWVDLRASDIEAQLLHYSQFKKLKGFRHILQGETQRDLILAPDFVRGIKALAKYQFTYDILIFPDQLKFADQLAKLCPDQAFVIDHLAKPYIAKGEITEWAKDIAAVAENKNVHCKISGMVTEADLKNWNPEDFIPYLDVLVKAFGMDRLMFGSDWPVCLLAGTYGQVLQVVTAYFRDFTKNEQEQFFGGNAIKFYNL